MKFSIQIPVLNEQDYIGRCISSIMMQDVDFEIIINNSGLCTDGTMRIIEAYKEILGDKIKIYNRPAGEDLHSSAKVCMDMMTGDVTYAMSAHTHFLEGTLKYVGRHIVNALYGAVLHEDGTVQTPSSPENMSSYAMFLSLHYLRENGLGFEAKYPCVADYVLRRKIWIMGDVQRTHKVLAMCSPRSYTRGRKTFEENNSDQRIPEYEMLRTDKFFQTPIIGTPIIDEAFSEKYPTSS